MSLGDSIRGKEGKISADGTQSVPIYGVPKIFTLQRGFATITPSPTPLLPTLWICCALIPCSSRDMHKFDVNASNLNRPAKVAARKGKVDLTAAPKRRRVFMIELGIKRRKHNS